MAKHYDENSKKPDRDPRGAFRNPVEGIGASTAGIVGPLGSSSFNLPNVERALVEMEGGAGPGSATGPDARKGPRRVSVPSVYMHSSVANWLVGRTRSPH